MKYRIKWGKTERKGKTDRKERKQTKNDTSSDLTTAVNINMISQIMQHPIWPSVGNVNSCGPHQRQHGWINPRPVAPLTAYFLFHNDLKGFPVICHYVLSSSVLGPLGFPHNNDDMSVCTPTICLSQSPCFMLCYLCLLVNIVVSNTSLLYE